MLESMGNFAFKLQQYTIGSVWARNIRATSHQASLGILANMEGALEAASRWPVIGWFAKLMRALFRGAMFASDFVRLWVSTRDYRAFAGAIPAVVMGVPFFVVLVSLPFVSDASLAQRYRVAAFEAIRDDEPAVADMFLQKVQQHGGETTRQMYARAILAAEKGNTSEAYELMLPLAPNDAVGFGFAHLWMARTLLMGDLKMVAERRQKLFEHHIYAASDRLPDDPQAKQFLAVMYRSTGQDEKAMGVLESMQHMNLAPTNLARLACMYAEWKQWSNATACARMAAVKFREDSDELTTASDFTWWSKAEQLSGRPVDAARPVLIGLGRCKDAPAEHQQLSAALLELSQSYLHSKRISADDWRSLADYLLQSTDDERVHCEVVGRLMSARDFADSYAVIRPHESRLAAQPLTLMGDGLLAQKEYVDARRVYHRSLELQQNNSVAHNNLAWLYAETEPIDLSAAIEHADRAVGAFPNEPLFLETRGQVLCKLERWEEAKQDLNRAINALPNSAGSIHQALAICYEKTGHASIAAAHQVKSARSQ